MGWRRATSKLRAGVTSRSTAWQLDVRKIDWASQLEVPVDRVLQVGDIIFCKVILSYLHLIKAIQGERFQIGNNRGRINGWISAGTIFGKCIEIGD